MELNFYVVNVWSTSHLSITAGTVELQVEIDYYYNNGRVSHDLVFMVEQASKGYDRYQAIG